MSLTELVQFRVSKFGNFYYFPVVVSGGSGSFTFSVPVTGKLYHRQVNPPNGSGAFSFYFSNTVGVTHDVHTTTGLSDLDDVALLINENQFLITGANGDGTYLVALWVGPI